ncbi:hypothetical protein [Halodurantibacterium flavum]|uniref:Uncharacterized protein n=1 Tax=Halodurantibacterium flavum TaxID=1382802 RepID=A0ABW4S9Q0_9RHOB
MTALALLAATQAAAAPEDYADYIPHNINDMELVDYALLENEFVAYYGETIGRATLRIFPAPGADANGQHAEDPPTSGETPAAQRAMLDLLSRNLSEGTNALGEGYVTNPVRLFMIRIDGGDAMAGSLACGYIERTQAEDRVEEGAEPMALSDRICLTQDGDDIVSVSITTPNRPSMPLNVDDAQITFSGLLIGTIIQLASEGQAEE